MILPRPVLAGLLIGGLLIGNSLRAAPELPSAATLAAEAATRYPQPVVVGTLIGREVLRPIESQPVLGRVRAVVRQPDGSIAVIVAYGGLRGLFGRPIAVPVDGMTLLGQYMDIVSFTPAQLRGFPTYTGGAARLPAASTIRVGLSRPSH